MESIIQIGAPIMGRTPNSVHPYDIKERDIFLALAALVVGFLFWEWSILSLYSPTFAVFLFLMIIVGTSWIYIRKVEVKQSKTAKAILMLTLISSCYFIVFDNTPLHFFVFAFSILMYATWIMKVSGTSVIKKLNGFILGDLLNQTIVIPFGNFAGMFRALFKSKEDSKKPILSLVIGLLISIPVIASVVFLLMQSDGGFESLVNNILSEFTELNFIIYIGEFLLGIPVACYFFGYVYGNHRKRKTDFIKYENINSRFIRLHAIPEPAVYGPVAVLNIIYIIFLAALGNYLFSAFFGDLPASMTYAEYARRGFFELCGVAAINLAIIAFSYTCIKRKEGDYPRTLRILTGSMSVFTILLVATAMSKMVLYISSYGMTRLRVYTFWFMVVVLFIFVLVLIWHFKSYNVGKPLIIGCVVLFMALAAANTDGLIAKYNIEAYEAGKINSLDTEMLLDLSTAAYPHVSSFADRTTDPAMKKEMEMIAGSIVTKHYEPYGIRLVEPDGTDNNPGERILRFNLQTLLMTKASTE